MIGSTNVEMDKVDGHAHFTYMYYSDYKYYEH